MTLILLFHYSYITSKSKVYIDIEWTILDKKHKTYIILIVKYI